MSNSIDKAAKSIAEVQRSEERQDKLAQLGARVLEILREREALTIARAGQPYKDVLDPAIYARDVEADRAALARQTVDMLWRAARSLGLLDQEAPK